MAMMEAKKAKGETDYSVYGGIEFRNIKDSDGSTAYIGNVDLPKELATHKELMFVFVNEASVPVKESLGWVKVKPEQVNGFPCERVVSRHFGQMNAHLMAFPKPILQAKDKKIVDEYNKGRKKSDGFSPNGISEESNVKEQNINDVFVA